MAKMSNQVPLPSEQRKPERAKASSRKCQQKGKGGPENAAFRFKGVRQRTWGKWVAELRIPRGGPVLWLGSFDNAVDAALSYDKAARALCGPNPKLNFPEVQPPENPPPSSPIKSQARVDTELQMCPPGASSSSSNTNRSHPGANASKLIPPGTGASSPSSSSNVLCPPGMTTYSPY